MPEILSSAAWSLTISDADVWPVNATARGVSAARANNGTSSLAPSQQLKDAQRFGR
jgi:hypothetical protein